MERNVRAAHDIEIIASSLKQRYTGVTSTVRALLPVQAAALRIAALGVALPADWPQMRWGDFFRNAWTPPSGKTFRIWHARRNNEMLLGCLLKSLLRMPLKLVFTSAAQRDHTRWTKFLISQMDAVIATSPEAGSFLKEPHTVIMHGVDTHIYRPPADRARAWVETGLPGKYGVGIFGRVRAQKGTDRFVEIMCRLLPKHPDFTAVIVGGITQDQSAFAERLKRDIKNVGLENRILFLGEQPAEEVPRWLGRVSIVVSPQRWEGFGLVPVEGMASESAVVATMVGAARHLIVEGQTGFLLEKDDVPGLEKRIDQLMHNEKLRAEIGRRGRQHVLQNFSIEREAAAIARIYQQLWNGSPSR